MPAKKKAPTATLDNLPLEKDEILKDYRLAYQSRQLSLIGRREVLSGKAKFGIFGDGKEVANIAIGHVFRKGDWRSGYYRDQTWMAMLGVMTLQQMFAQLYAHADLEAEPNTMGRAMNAHFATRLLNPDGSWRDQTREGLKIDPRYEILYLLALGKPKETVVVEPVGPDGDIKYWHDPQGGHHVPKRSLDEIIVG